MKLVPEEMPILEGSVAQRLEHASGDQDVSRIASALKKYAMLDFYENRSAVGTRKLPADPCLMAQFQRRACQARHVDTSVVFDQAGQPELLLLRLELQAIISNPQ